MSKEKCSVCKQVFDLPDEETSKLSLSFEYGDRKLTEEYEIEFCCLKCAISIRDGMYAGMGSIHK